MMGHPGDAAIMPLAEEASKAGIKMMYQNVDVPKVAAEVRRRLCRRPARPAGPRARRGGGPPLRAEDGRQGDRVRHRSTTRTALCAKPRPPNALEDAGLEGHRAQLAARMGGRSEPRHSGRAPRRSQANPDTKLDRLSRRPAARQRPGLHAGGRQEAGRDHQYRLRHQPADRRGLQGRLGPAHLRPAALPAGLHADPVASASRSSTASAR